MTSVLMPIIICIVFLAWSTKCQNGRQRKDMSLTVELGILFVNHSLNNIEKHFYMHDKEKFKILSIDGGGIRGIIPAKILYHLEEEAVKRHGPESRLCDYFDMVCGTSTGGIIAIGIALGMKAKDILELYKQNASIIFPPKSPLRSFFHNKPLYDRASLQKLLSDNFNKFDPQDNLARIYHCKTRLCIPTYDLCQGAGHVFKTDHLNNLQRDCHIPLVSLALATAAAPVYFSPYSFTYSEMNSCNTGSYLNNVDGGVLANNPTLIGLTEAHYCIGIPLEQIEVLSLGTGTITLKDNNTKSPKGPLYWLLPSKRKGFRIYEIMSSGQSVFIDNTMKMICNGAGHDQKKRFNYLRIQKKLDESIAMDSSDSHSLTLLENIGQDLYKQNLELLKPFILQKAKQYNHNFII